MGRAALLLPDRASARLGLGFHLHPLRRRSRGRMKQRGNKYSTAYVSRARELYRAGWTNCSEVARMLQKEFGRAPNSTTIRKWVDPDYYEAVKTRERVGGVSGPNRLKTWKLRFERIVQLTRAGLDADSAALVLQLDFGLEIDADDVTAMLAGTMAKPRMEGLLYPKGAGE